MVPQWHISIATVTSVYLSERATTIAWLFPLNQEPVDTFSKGHLKEKYTGKCNAATKVNYWEKTPKSVLSG
jgi:hypothetical protein